MSSERPQRSGGAAALMVGAGIFLSRIAGFVRSRALAHYLGAGDAADAFTYAMKLPNLLQNLFGEGVLSASFIPVYVRLMEERREDEARRVAGAVASMLALIVSLLVLGGVLAAPLLVDVFAAGYHGEKREACIRLVRILFPSTGILVLSAWCLGVLNSHRRFFLSYVAPVMWNAAIIAALVLQSRLNLFAGRPGGQGYALATAAAWGAVAGSILQLLVQLPMTLYLLRGFRPGLGRLSTHVGQVGRSFVPVVLGRGVLQISSWIDTLIVSFLSTGAMAGLGYAQMLYLLPISLFGMAVSASELPEMARAASDTQADTLAMAAKLRPRLLAGLRRMAFFVVAATIAFVALGDMVVALVYRTGRFGASDTLFVWAILAGFSLGLLAATQARLFSSAFYALGDTRTPFRVAVVRVFFGTSLGAGLAFLVPPLLHLEPRWGVVGLSAASGIAAWIELALLRRKLARRLGETIALPGRALALLLLTGALAAAGGFATKYLLVQVPHRPHPALAAALVLGVFGLLYLLIGALLRIPEALALLGRFGRRRRR
jgi:putative peptidoglycan lipid II flippase